MITSMVRIIASALALTFLAAIAAESQAAFSTYQQRVAVVTSTPGWVAFWDFVKREPDGAHRFIAHVPQGATNDFALDAGNYVKDYWGEGREASYPHDLYTPKDAQSGGPFTIGRVIHSSRSVGYTGWIGGVAVFNRALRAEEMAKLAAIVSALPISTPSR
jgi:hypothetical protein